MGIHKNYEIPLRIHSNKSIGIPLGILTFCWILPKSAGTHGEGKVLDGGGNWLSATVKA